MSDEETTQINVEVPKRTKKLAKKQLEHGGLTRLVRESLERVAHGEQTTEIGRVKDHLRELRDERQELRNDRENIDNQLDDVERKIERAEYRLDELRDAKGEYEGALQMLEEAMHNDSMRVFEGHGQVEEVALIGNCSQKDVLTDLRERNPELPDKQFEPGVEL